MIKETAMILSLSAGLLSAATVSVTDGTGNNYGNFDGFAIDFDASTGITADWAPDLQVSETYSIDSVSLFELNDFNADLFLGVYTGFNESTGALSGFEGVSTNTINFNSLPGTNQVTWNFSGITVTVDDVAGAGSGVRYFALQTESTAIATINNFGDDTTAVRRIDGETGSFTDELAAVIDGGGGADRLKGTRAPEYEASVTLIPEPSTSILGAVAALAFAGARRRK